MGIFTNVLEQGRTGRTTSGIIRPGTDEARDWYRDLALSVRSVRVENIVRKNPEYNRLTIKPGFLYLFNYDPKTKEKLKYYDRFPLVIPIETYPDGFLGLNLHYIHPKHRLILLDKLSDTASNKKLDANTRLRISYDYCRKNYNCI